MYTEPDYAWGTCIARPFNWLIVIICKRFSVEIHGITSIQKGLWITRGLDLKQISLECRLIAKFVHTAWDLIFYIPLSFLVKHINLFFSGRRYNNIICTGQKKILSLSGYLVVKMTNANESTKHCVMFYKAIIEFLSEYVSSDDLSKCYHHTLYLFSCFHCPGLVWYNTHLPVTWRGGLLYTRQPRRLFG